MKNLDGLDILASMQKRVLSYLPRDLKMVVKLHVGLPKSYPISSILAIDIELTVLNHINKLMIFAYS